MSQYNICTSIVCYTLHDPRRALKRGVVLDCTHGSSTRGRYLTSGLVHLLTDKNKELFQIEPVEGPRVGGVKLVEWCICEPTRKALKQRVVPDRFFSFQQK